MSAFLDRLREWLLCVEPKSAPLIVPVPGNHDLARPTGRAAFQFRVFDLLERGRDDSDVALLEDELWVQGDTSFVAPLFENYQARLTKDMEPDLAQHARVHVDMFRRFEQALSFMHHPPAWLEPRSRKAFCEALYPPERFRVLLHGHLHEGGAETVALYGGKPRHFFQARSVFGLEDFGKSTETRLNGYAWGSLSRTGEVRVWPLARVERGRGEHAFDWGQRFGAYDERGVKLRDPDPAAAAAAAPASAPATAAVTAPASAPEPDTRRLPRLAPRSLPRHRADWSRRRGRGAQFRRRVRALAHLCSSAR